MLRGVVRGPSGQPDMQVIKNIFGVCDPRTGKLSLSPRAEKQMETAGLEMVMLDDVFRYGQEVRENVFVRDYDTLVIGMIVRPDDSTVIPGRYIVKACWVKRCE